MSKCISALAVFVLIAGCTNTGDRKPSEVTSRDRDTVRYPFKATYSSNITVPGRPEYAQKVLTVWKMFELCNFDSMKSFYADTVTYDPAGGGRFHGSSVALMSYAKKDIESLDSLRFDISTWQSVHINDKNEDWVYIWARERRYAKDGTADTSLTHEQWKIEKGKVVYFNQYLAKSPLGS